MRISTGLLVAAFAVTACNDGPTAPEKLSAPNTIQSNRSKGEEPHFNLNIVLRGDGSGHVKFRQPGNEATPIVYLKVRVRHLEPNTSYQLQRAVDATLDGICTSTAWLTLGAGTVPRSIVTNEKGKGRADLFRNLATPGNTFDIHFRLIRESDKAVVLTSKCYRFTVR